MAGDSTGYEHDREGQKRSAAPAPCDLLAHAVRSGDIAALRGYIDRAFWEKRAVRAEWPHLFAALKSDNADIARILVLHGARASAENLRELQDDAPEKYAGRLRLLRRAGHIVRRAGLAPLKREKTAAVSGSAKEEQPEGTIDLGLYVMRDDENGGLAKVFNVYAAPEDLPESMSYIGANQYVSRLRGWHGYDGELYAHDGEIWDALRNGTYKGGWVIPPRQLLSGSAAQAEPGSGQTCRGESGSIFTHISRQSGLSQSFKRAVDFEGYAGWYWSSTRHAVRDAYFWAASFPTGFEGCLRRDDFLLSCRPVRLVAVGDGGA